MPEYVVEVFTSLFVSSVMGIDQVYNAVPNGLLEFITGTKSMREDYVVQMVCPALK